jgi:hypothetical protein
VPWQCCQGDACPSELLEEHNLADLSEGVLWALGQLPPSAILASGLQEVNAKINSLVDLIKVVDKDHQKASCYLLGKLGLPPLLTPQKLSRQGG